MQLLSLFYEMLVCPQHSPIPWLLRNPTQLRQQLLLLLLRSSCLLRRVLPL